MKKPTTSPAVPARVLKKLTAKLRAAVARTDRAEIAFHKQEDRMGRLEGRARDVQNDIEDAEEYLMDAEEEINEAGQELSEIENELRTLVGANALDRLLGRPARRRRRKGAK